MHKKKATEFAYLVKGCRNKTPFLLIFILILIKGSDWLIMQKVHICLFIREKCVKEMNIVKESFEVLEVVNDRRMRPS